MIYVCYYNVINCGEFLDEDRFQKAAVINGKVYYRKYCTSCKIAQQQIRIEKIRNYVYSIKKNSVCSVCGYSDYRALEFHHLDRNEKEDEISNMIRKGFVIPKIQKEIEKCSIVCANCHTILHFNEHENNRKQTQGGSPPLEGGH